MPRQILDIIKGKIETAGIMVRSTENWPSAVLFKAGALKRFDARFRGATAPSPFSTFAEYRERAYLKAAGYDFEKGTMSILDPKSRQPMTILTDAKHALLVWSVANREYNKFDVRDSVVVDIGAFQGETSVLWALRGAHKIFAFEPNIQSAAIAQKNVQRNGLGGRIEIFNEAVGGEPGKIHIDGNRAGNPHLIAQDTAGGTELKVRSLNAIVAMARKAAQGRPLALKVDCEGAEYGIFAGASDPTIKSFREITVEYHHGIQDIGSRLSGLGYKITHTRPGEKIFDEGAGEWREIGIIHAVRKED